MDTPKSPPNKSKTLGLEKMKSSKEPKEAELVSTIS